MEQSISVMEVEPGYIVETLEHVTETIEEQQCLNICCRTGIRLT